MNTNYISPRDHVEEWRPAKGWEGYIEVSNMGRVRTVDRVIVYSNGKKRLWKGQLRKGVYDKDGYLRVSLKFNGKSKTKPLHRLVAETFLPLIEGKNEVDHINGVRDDNRLENLRFCNPQENSTFPIAYKNRRQAVINSYNKYPELRRLRAETFGRSGLKSLEAFFNGESIGKFESQVDFAKGHDMSQSMVSIMYRTGREYKGYTIKPC